MDGRAIIRRVDQVTSQLTPEQSHFIGMLRSGEIEQARNKLRDRDAMCCLGVMCESFRIQTGSGRWYGDVFIFGDNEDQFIGMPPVEVVQFFFGPDDDAIYVDGNEADPWIARNFSGKEEGATSANDEYKYSFDKIADLFESAFQGVLLEIEDEEPDED